MNKSPHRPYNSTPRSTIRPADKAKGEAAELAFQVWLDASGLPHLYIDQTPMTVPDHLRGQLKRPDYLVGVPGVGSVAFDVKAKSLYGGGLIFDVDEVQRLRTFARLFHLSVFFACLDPEGGPYSYWVRLDQLDNKPAERRGSALTLSIGLDEALPVSLRESFHTAFVEAVKLPNR